MLDAPCHCGWVWQSASIVTRIIWNASCLSASASCLSQTLPGKGSGNEWLELSSCPTLIKLQHGNISFQTISHRKKRIEITGLGITIMTKKRDEITAVSTAFMHSSSPRSFSAAQSLHLRDDKTRREFVVRCVSAYGQGRFATSPTPDPAIRKQSGFRSVPDE